MRPPSTRVQNRRGFALVLVIVTIAVLLGFWAMAYRETASLIRVESSRLLNQTRGVQSVHAMTALDQALTLLEVSIPTNRTNLRLHLHRERNPTWRCSRSLSLPTTNYQVQATAGPCR